MFKFRSGTHGLNKELGRHRGREGRKKECLLWDDECESVSHVLWDCAVYNTLRNDFMCRWLELLRDRFEHFESLDSFEKIFTIWNIRMTMRQDRDDYVHVMQLDNGNSQASANPIL